MTDEILFDCVGAWGVITLNRPAVLNALTLEMVAAMRAALVDLEGDADVKAVLVKGAGSRAFCAGADIRRLAAEAKDDPAGVCDFFREEYRNNAAIYHFTKPYVALIDGVAMGGGVGISVHGDFRVAGDRTLFAMPETAIGLFPDVGGGHFMPRMHDGLGLYYALTGARANAADCMAAGVATHYAPTDKMAELEEALYGLSFGLCPHADVEAALDCFAGDPGAAPINDKRRRIAALFLGHERFEDLWAALEHGGGDFAAETFEILQQMSPTSLKLTFEQMKRGALLDFDDVMRMEFRMVRRVMEGHDFFEGVRAQIIDKDRAPKWSPASVEKVSDKAIEKCFAPLEGEEELELP
ncbi:MAG: enoyl-CoA hydratase/isomerase family protein [Parvularculaceae bacterium]